MFLKTRITIATVTSIALVAVTLLVLGNLIESSLEERFQAVAVNGKSALWQKIITSEFDRMGSNTGSIARDRETLKALKSSNVALLNENAVTTYNMLSAGSVLTKLQIADLEGRILFSAPDSFKGRTQKTLHTIALEEGKIKRGIERDDDGKLYANLVFPVYVRGKLVGVVLYMRDLQSAVEDFKLNDKSDIFIIGTEGGGEYVTDKDLLDQLNLELPELGLQSMSDTEMGDKAYSIAIQPVLGADGRALAHLVSAKDQTDSYQEQKALLFISYISVIIVLLISVGGLTWYLRKNFKPLDTVVEVMNRISHGDLTDKVDTVGRMDEIGQLMYAMSSMTDNLRRIVGEVYEATDAINQSSYNLSSINANMSQLIQEQSSSLDETSASLVQSHSIVQQNDFASE